MKHVLIVSPRFPPVNAADHHRVRMAIPYLEQFGWRATVLHVEPQYVDSSHDELLNKTIPDHIRCVGVRAIPYQWTRKLGFGGLSIRAKHHIAHAGDVILQDDSCDLVYFSTTEFGVLPLGPRWKKKFGVPYVLDIQDPWVNDYYRKHGQRPPGGKLKHGITQWLASRSEPQTMREASHTTVVSSHYSANLMARYDDLDESQFTTLPFAATPRDFEIVAQENVLQKQFDPGDGFEHWVYIGRCGPDMRFSLTSLLTAFRMFRETNPARAASIKMHFIGTDYASGDRARYWVEPIASALGIGDHVVEMPHRIGYFELLRCLQQAHALVVPGSDDPRYTASKLYPYISAKRPLLTVFHEDSSVNQIMQSTNAGVNVSFGGGDSIQNVASRIASLWFDCSAFTREVETDWDAFEPFTAQEMTRTLAQIFDKVSGKATS